MAPYNLYISYNNGVDYALVDTTSDSTYSWIAPNILASQCKFLISDDDSTITDESDNPFYLLPYSQLDIIYPIDKSGVALIPGDTLHVNVESMFVDNLWLYWSNDSTLWHFIDSTVVDTVNMQYKDTTNYVWTLTGAESGPEIWIKVEEQADTNIYVFDKNYIQLGEGLPLGNLFCQTASGTGFVEQFVLYDPSCGWSSVEHRYYTGTLNDLAESRSWTYNPCPWPWTDTTCVFERATPVWIVDGVDTTETYMDTFYGVPSTTVTYKNRVYFVADSTLYCNDLVNGIDSIFISDLSYLYELPAGESWYDGYEKLQMYQVQRSKISGDTLDTNTDWESLNDEGFEPKLLVGTTQSPYSTIAITALGYPADLNPASDTEKILTGAFFRRFYFRGIHPKIEKR
jgi:hypothetical protein